MIKKRLPFTLLEVLIVFAILLTLGGVIGLNIKKAINEQRFKSEVSTVLDTLRLAQDLMLLLKQDVDVVFRANKDKSIDYSLEFVFPAPAGWEGELKRDRRPLTAIHRVEMKDGREIDLGKEGELVIRFYSGGDVMTQGNLLLSNHFSEQENSTSLMNRYICLLGYPSELYASEEREKCPKESDKPFNEQLTASMVTEIHALQKS